MGLLRYISYIALVGAFGFVTLSLASGLLYLSELIEEHSRLAKYYGQRGIYVIIALHTVLCIFDSLPLPQTTFSIFCHAIYLQNFSASWPLISLTSPSFLASCVLVILDHFMWFFYFSHSTREGRQKRTHYGPIPPNVPGFGDIAAFFSICVWLAPLFLFLSLSANDNALPTSAAFTDPAAAQPARQRVSLFKSLFSKRKSQKDNKEDIFSPSPELPSFPPPPSHPPRISSPGPPPPSPGYNHEHDIYMTSSGIDGPPRRLGPALRRLDERDLGRRRPIRQTSSATFVEHDIN